MPVAGADDRGILMAVSGAVVIDPRLVPAGHIMGDCVGIRAELDAAERHACTGKGVSHTGGADKGIDVSGRLAIERHSGGQNQKWGQKSLHIPKVSKDSRKS
jgi:hypothetical protein